MTYIDVLRADAKAVYNLHLYWESAAHAEAYADEVDYPALDHAHAESDKAWRRYRALDEEITRLTANQ